MKKHQHPTSNIQRSSNNQVPNPTARQVRGRKYPEIRPDAWELKEGASGNGSRQHEFDLEERTAKFGEAIVKFTKKIPRDPTNNRLLANSSAAEQVSAQITAKPTRPFQRRISRTPSSAVSRKPRR